MAHEKTVIDGQSVSAAKVTLGIGDGAENLSAPYSGTDTPGTGSNILTVGNYRIWNDGTTSWLVYHASAGDYRAVELTTWA